MSSTLTSLGRHNLTLPADELKERLYQACMAAARTPPVAELKPLDAARDEDGVLFSRYETLLAAGARLFRAQGYPAVSTSEIGKGAGIAGPGLYRSFSSKQAILDALIRRLDEWWSLECIRALRTNSEAAQRLQGLVEGHVRISLDAPDLVAVSITELSHASGEVRDGYLRNQADRETVWIDLITRAGPRDHRRRGATAGRGGDQLHRRRCSHMASHAIRRSRGRNHRDRTVDPDQPVRIRLTPRVGHHSAAMVPPSAI